jgi:Na+-transporting NADH:ubiquinone oxidoreductase subunit NqrA
LNGEERAFVVTGEMEKFFPMDIYPMQLIKECMTGNIEKMENDVRKLKKCIIAIAVDILILKESFE